MATQQAINLRTHEYNDLTIAQRATAIDLAYQDGRESMELDIAGDSVEIADYKSLAAPSVRDLYAFQIVDLEWQIDRCTDAEHDAWKNGQNDGDPRIDAFLRGWQDRERDLRADAITA